MPKDIDISARHTFTPEEESFGSEYFDAQSDVQSHLQDADIQDADSPHKSSPDADLPSPSTYEANAFESEEDDEGEVEDCALPRDPIAALPAWCSACYGSGCQRCLAVCPAQAISLDSALGPHIDEARCTQCGLCAGICDAFISTRYTLTDLYNHVIRNAREEGCVYFTCTEHLTPGIQPRDNVIVLPCLAAVPPEFWAAVMAEDIPLNIYRDPAHCHECSIAGPQGATLFEYALRTAQAWMGGHVRTCHTLPEKGNVLETLSRIDENDRRGLFSTLAQEGKDIATGQHRKRNSGTTSSFHEQQDRLRAEGRIRSASRGDSAHASEALNALNQINAAFAVKYPWDRQALLVAAVQKHPERAAGIERYSTTTHETLCCHSHQCITTCPTGARSINHETGAVQTDPTLCIACGACVATCPSQACDFVSLTAQAYCPSQVTKG